MAAPKKKRIYKPPQRRRQEVNTDAHWVNWEYLAAFGADELGYTYLAAVKRHCCAKSEVEE